MRVVVTKSEEVNTYNEVDKVYFCSKGSEVPIDIDSDDFHVDLGRILILNMQFIHEVELTDEDEGE